MKKLIILAIAVITAGCSHKSVSEQLREIDTLIAHEQYDSADSALMKIEQHSLSNSQSEAYYHLLRTHVDILLGRRDSTNVLDSIVIPHYTNTANQEKLAEAYYCRGSQALLRGELAEAIHYLKEAEAKAAFQSNARLRYKTAEILAVSNDLSGNSQLHLDYAKKSLRIAEDAQNKEWEAYANYQTALAHSRLAHEDSTLVYLNKVDSLVEYIPLKDRADFLIGIAYLHKDRHPERAKRCLEESLSLRASSLALEHLADIYDDEGRRGEAYDTWRQALAINDGNPKDNILHNLLVYDVEHGQTDEVCDKVNEIIHTKDSIISRLLNDTIKDMQLRFDHNLAMYRQQKITDNWQKGTLSALLFLMLATAYIVKREYKEKFKMQSIKMQVSDYQHQIQMLEVSGKEASEAIAKLNKEIKDLLDKESPTLKHGKILHDHIMDGGTISSWTVKEERLLVNYYETVNYNMVKRLRRQKRREKLTPHNLIYLILVEMGKNDSEIARIFGISQTAIRSLKWRTQPTA